ncbi:phosphotransferase family protein [Ureibacillus sp. MALMAid1270]|uniref:phosphotransferase family protein n=1 Tax=Ureibacillus sp. MALMAid1270 TaxID=3411629 RepID=UPI003BA4E376
MQIKSNIWKQESPDDTLFIKKYDNEMVAEKVKFIHQQLEAIEFPYAIPLKKTNEPNLIVQSWQHRSYSADFSDRHHRREVVRILKSLHDTNKMINWKNHVIIPRQNLYNKWTARLERFLSYEKELVPYLQHSYYDITLYADRILRKMRKQAEKKSSNFNLTLLHGDVVHHNFLITREGMKLIDFDLSVVGDPADELILWLHRALPTVGYDLQKLISESQYLSELCLPKLHYLQYPNELLREWLYILQLGDLEKEEFLDYLMPFTEKALRHWPELIVKTEKLK